MLKFTVIGTYEDNGQRVALHVEAKDPTDAEKAAQREAIKLNGWNGCPSFNHASSIDENAIPFVFRLLFFSMSAHSVIIVLTASMRSVAIDPKLFDSFGILILCAINCTQS